MVTDDSDPLVLTTRLRRHRCGVCRQGFVSQGDLQAHRATDRHRGNFCYLMWKEKRYGDTQLRKPLNKYTILYVLCKFRSELVKGKLGMRLLYVGPEAAGDTTVKQDAEEGTITVQCPPGRFPTRPLLNCFFLQLAFKGMT